MWNLKKSSWFLFFGLMAISCLDKPDCFQLKTNVIAVLFKVIGTNKTDLITLSEIQVQGMSTIYYQGDTVLNSLPIPLNYLKDETAVTILSKEVSGTMLLRYLSQAQFVSEECGPRYVLSDLTIADHSGFDSVNVINNQIGNPPYINIEIYRCPITNLVKFDFYQLYITSPDKKTSQLLKVNINDILAEYSGQVSYQNTSTNTVTLPINLVDSASNYKMTIDGEPNNVSLAYHLTKTIRYNACGEQTFASALKATSTDFDSVSIAINTATSQKKLVDAPQDPAVTNVLIFRCPKTNLMKVGFKTPKGQSFVAVSVPFVSIKNNFSSDVYYSNITASTVELPVDSAATEAEYYFEMKDAGGNVFTDTLKVNYGSIPKTLFNSCGEQSVYNRLTATYSEDVLTQIVVPKDSLQFPSVTNIEIIKN